VLYSYEPAYDTLCPLVLSSVLYPNGWAKPIARLRLISLSKVLTAVNVEDKIAEFLGSVYSTERSATKYGKDCKTDTWLQNK